MFLSSSKCAILKIGGFSYIFPDDVLFTFAGTIFKSGFLNKIISK